MLIFFTNVDVSVLEFASRKPIYDLEVFRGNVILDVLMCSLSFIKMCEQRAGVMCSCPAVVYLY